MFGLLSYVVSRFYEMFGGGGLGNIWLYLSLLGDEKLSFFNKFNGLKDNSVIF